MNKNLKPKQLRILELLAQKRSANFIVSRLGVKFHEVFKVWRTKGFRVKRYDFDVERLVALFKEGGSS